MKEKTNKPNENIMNWNDDAVRFPQTFTSDTVLLYDSFGPDNLKRQDKDFLELWKLLQNFCITLSYG